MMLVLISPYHSSSHDVQKAGKVDHRPSLALQSLGVSLRQQLAKAAHQLRQVLVLQKFCGKTGKAGVRAHI